jgi:ABC-2 type transport system ATP-binding protein
MILRLAPALAAALALFAAGCQPYHRVAPQATDYRDNLVPYHYQAELVAPDGVKVRFTVFQPFVKRRGSAPLIIHAHGFALDRMESTVDFYRTLQAGKAAMEAWRSGYFVISVDQRGHGGTGGKVALMDMDAEIADISRVIDWAMKNLPVSTIDNDPLVGMVGESYGGAVQLLASVRDPRIDAIIPMTTWYDLEQALLPNGVPKSSWITFLGMAGYGRNPSHMDGDISAGVFREIFDNPQPELRARLRNSSLAGHCDGEEMPHADALIIQGFRDVLFPVNQGLAMRDCFARAGRDVRFVAIEHGHLQPTAQLSPGKPIWFMENPLACDGKRIEFRDMAVAWFDAKLRQRPKRADMVPRFCLTGDTEIDMVGTPPAAVEFAFDSAAIGTGSSGLVEWLARPLESSVNLLRGNDLPEDWYARDDGGLRPARIPLLVADSSTWVVGEPRVSLELTDVDREDATVFVRLARWTPGKGNYRVLSQQVTPVRGAGRHDIALNAVRVRLEPGEVLGLLVQGYSSQFRLTGSGFGTDATVRGTIALPVQGTRWVSAQQAAVAHAERIAAAEAAQAAAEAAATVEAGADAATTEATTTDAAAVDVAAPATEAAAADAAEAAAAEATDAGDAEPAAEPAADGSTASDAVSPGA